MGIYGVKIDRPPFAKNVVVPATQRGRITAQKISACNLFKNKNNNQMNKRQNVIYIEICVNLNLLCKTWCTTAWISHVTNVWRHQLWRRPKSGNNFRLVISTMETVFRIYVITKYNWKLEITTQ